MRQDAEEWRISCSDKAYQRWSKPWVHRSRADTTSMVPPSRHEVSTVAPLPAAITAAAGARMAGHDPHLSAYGTVLGEIGALTRGVLVVEHGHAGSLAADADRLIDHQDQWSGLDPRTCREAVEQWAAATMARRCLDRPTRVLKEIPS